MQVFDSMYKYPLQLDFLFDIIFLRFIYIDICYYCSIISTALYNSVMWTVYIFFYKKLDCFHMCTIQRNTIMNILTFSGIATVLVSLGYRNKVTFTGWFKQPKFIFSQSQKPKFKIRVPMWLDLVRALPWLVDSHLLAMASHGRMRGNEREREGEIYLFLCYQFRTPSLWNHLTLITY